MTLALAIAALLIALYATWSAWQNTKAIKSMLRMNDKFNEILREIIKRMEIH